MSSSCFLFEGVVWRLQERKTTFYAPRYSQERLLVRRQVLPFWSRPQPIAQLSEQGEFVVLHVEDGDAAKVSGDAKESKKLLRVTARAMSDLLRAQKYQTAARTQTLELFVDVEHTREKLQRCLQGPNDEETEKKLLDDAFEALEKAQQSTEREAALALYKQAESSFYEAEKVLRDDRSRELIKTRRGDLQRTIRTLEEVVNGAKRINAKLRERPVVTTPETTDISARLEELREFAARQEIDQTTDLASRLAALKNEKAGPTAPVRDLAERLRRLRRDDGPAAVVQVAGETTDKKNAVDRIIEQVAEEIAMGIDDADFEEDQELDYDSDSDSSQRAPTAHAAASRVSSRKRK